MPESLSRLTAALADRYRLEQELGAGGMATVYLAEDLKHGRKVAIKVLRPELAAVIGAERFVREIRTIAALQHPHILGLIDSGEVDGTAYYVMPFVEGESLRDRLGREKQLPIADAVRIATEVASALDYAHRHGVIHRDIKPENILLHDGQALVADFGIALAASKTGGSRMTETGMSLGTPHYMSPEQAMGEREITARSDVYALGCVTYEMLSGEPPFSGPTAQAIVAKVLTEEPRPLLPKRHTVPRHIEAAVLTALEKLPADRFASALEFAEALGNASLMPRTAGSTAGRAIGRLGTGRRAILLFLAGLLLAAAGLVAGRRLNPGREDTRAAQTLPGPDHRLGMPGASNVAVSPDGRSIAFVRVSPKGDQILFERGDRDSPLTDVWLYQTAGQGWTRITSHPEVYYDFAWSPYDGELDRVRWRSRFPRVHRLARSIQYHRTSNPGQERPADAGLVAGWIVPRGVGSGRDHRIRPDSHSPCRGLQLASALLDSGKRRIPSAFSRWQAARVHFGPERPERGIRDPDAGCQGTLAGILQRRTASGRIPQWILHRA